MPYPGEFAKHHVLRRLTENSDVKDLITQCVEPDLNQVKSNLEPTFIERIGFLPKFVIAIDGSHQEISYVKGYPGAELAYINIASVLLDIELLLSLDKARPVNPHEFSKVERVEPMSFALPSANMVLHDEVDARASFRRYFMSILARNRPYADCETLLETYEYLLKFKPDVKQQCPYLESCDGDNIYRIQKGQYSCSCESKKPLYSTDALRFHERFHDNASNGGVFGEVMQVVEHLWLISYLRAIEKKQWWRVLKQIAFVMDGPLAIFGQPAWLSQAIKKELYRLNDLAKKINGCDILLLGIEKTGMFFDHLCILDQHENGSPGRLENGSLFLLTNQYIRKHIVIGEAGKLYGEATYYGRKFFYKTKTGALIVAVSPFYTEHHSELKTASIEQHPRLCDILNLLDTLVSSRYPNALIPLIAAHAEAAIPSKMGKKVLEQLAKQLISTNNF